MAVKIKIYSTPECPFCRAAKKFLKEKNMEFEDIDVSSNPKAIEEIKKKSGQIGVPVIEIKRNRSVGIIVGFDREKLKQMLDIK